MPSDHPSGDKEFDISGKPDSDPHEKTTGCTAVSKGSSTSDRSSTHSLGIEPVYDHDGIPSDPEKGECSASSSSPSRPRRSAEATKRTVGRVLSRVATHLTTRTLPEPPPPPDGGPRAWAQVACGCVVIFVTWGYVNSFGAWQTYYTGVLPEPASTISWIGAVQLFLTFFTSAFSGRLLDAGFFVPTLAAGSVLQLAGIFLMSVSTRFWHLMLTQGVLTGIGGGLFFTPAMGLIATYFDKRRAIAVGLATLGNSVGGMTYPIIVRELLPVLGFSWTVRVIGFLNLAGLTFVNLLMRPRLPPRRAGPVIDWSAFTEPLYMSYATGLIFMNFGFYYTFYYVGSFARETLGMSYSDATVLVIIVNGVGVPARFVTPFIAARYGPVNTSVPLIGLIAIASFTWLAVRGTAGFYVFTSVYGFLQGGLQCLTPTTVASITPRLDKVGTRLGMVFTLMSLSALTGPPIGGEIQKAMGGVYTGAIGWAAGCTLIAFGLFVVARGFRTRWKWRYIC